MLNILLNHTVETHETTDDYVGKSADEIALLEAAKNHWSITYTRQFNEHGRRIKVVTGWGKKESESTFPVVHTLDFDSRRKRMSVLV